MKGKTLSQVLNSESFNKLSPEQQDKALEDLFPGIYGNKEKGRLSEATGEFVSDKKGHQGHQLKIESPLDLGTPLEKNVVGPIKNFNNFGGGHDSPVAQHKASGNLKIEGPDLSPYVDKAVDFLAKTSQFGDRVDSPVGIHQTVISDPNKDQSFYKVTGLDNPENFIDKKTGKMSTFYMGTTNSIPSRLMGQKPEVLPEDASLADEVKFALGKMSLDLPVIAGVGVASGGIGLGGLATAALSFGAYEGLDRGTDISARRQHGMLNEGEEGLNPLEEGLKAAPIGALKGGLGHVAGLTSMVAVRGLQGLAAKGGANAMVAHRVSSMLQPVAYNVAQNEVMGQMTAAQHGTDYNMRSRVVDSITTAGVNLGTASGRKSLSIIKKHAPEIEARIKTGSDLDGYVEQLAKKEVKSTADDAAKRYFKRGGTPEETARLTLAEIQKRTSSDSFGHPFKNPQDKIAYEKMVYDAAKKIDMDNSDPLSLNQKGAELTDGFPIHRLGEGLKGKADNLKKLEEARGKERSILEEYNEKVGKVSPDELTDVLFRLDGARTEQRALYESVQVKSRKDIYGLMKKDAKALDAQKDMEVVRADIDDMYSMPLQEYAEVGAKRLLNLPQESIVDMAMKSNLKKFGKVAKLYNTSLKSATRYMDQVLGEQNSNIFKQALRGADAKRTETIDRMYKKIENMRKNMSPEEERTATIYMVRKQMVRKKVKYEDGTKGEELVNVGEQKIKDMIELGYVTPEELAASNTLNQRQIEFVSSSRDILDEIWGLTTKSRKIMGKDKVEGLPEYFPLVNDIEAVTYAPKTKGMEIGWENEASVRKKMSPNDPKNLKKRLDVKSVVSLDGSRVLENYTRYMVNKAYMNPVADKLMRLGKSLNSLHGNDAGMDMIRHAKFISGDVDPVINKTVDQLLSKVARNVSQAMLVGNYSTYLTQLSALDGIVAECGYKNVNDTIKQLGFNQKMWDEVINQSAVLTARKGAGDITIVDLQNSLREGFRKQMVQKGMYPIQALDMVAATIGWKSFYDKAIRNGMRDMDARAYADDFVVRTQASSSRIDAPPVMRNSLGKNLFTLQTFSLNRFDYLVSDLFGVQPTYKFMKLIDDEDTARQIAKEKGWHMEPLAKGKKGYAVYDPVKSHNYLEATRKMARLLVAQSLFNMAYDGMEELSTMPLAKPNPDPVGAFIEKKYGVSITGKMLGANEKGSNLEESERNRRAMVAVGQEMSEMVPLASSLFKYTDSMGGASLSKLISGSRRAQYFAETGNVVTGLQSANDFSALLGNPAHALTSKLLIRFKGQEEEEKREEKAFNDRIKALKQIRNRSSRPSRPTLKIER